MANELFVQPGFVKRVRCTTMKDQDKVLWKDLDYGDTAYHTTETVRTLNKCPKSTDTINRLDETTNFITTIAHRIAGGANAVFLLVQFSELFAEIPSSHKTQERAINELHTQKY